MLSNKVNVHLMQYALKEREVNSIRYYLACRLLDKNGKGWVYISDVKPELSILFGVTEKTVQNNIYTLASKGIGRINSGRFYYNSLESVTLGLGPSINRKAVEVTLETLRGGVVNTRAFFEKAFLATVPHSITRDKITERIGISRNTQRKYESKNGVEETKKFGFVDFGKLDKKYLALLRHHGEPIFFVNDGGMRIYRQIGNQYNVNLDLVKRKVRKGTFSHMPKTPAKKLFHNDLDQAFDYWQNEGESVDALYKYKENSSRVVFSILHNKSGPSMVVDKYFYEANL